MQIASTMAAKNRGRMLKAVSKNLVDMMRFVCATARSSSLPCIL
jgi:hypothetical protein